MGFTYFFNLLYLIYFTGSKFVTWRGIRGYNQKGLIFLLLFSSFFFLSFEVWGDMGNASSMLTQYDIEEVQEFCNNLCRYSLLYFFLLSKFWTLSWVFWFGVCKLVSQQEIVALYERFCQLDRTAKGFISADEFLSVPEFALNPLSQVIKHYSTFLFIEYLNWSD